MQHIFKDQGSMYSLPLPLQTNALIILVTPHIMHLIFSKASSRTSCVDLMARKGNDVQVCNLSTLVTGYILCIEKTGLELFYQGFLKMADDWTGSVCPFKITAPITSNH